VALKCSALIEASSTGGTEVFYFNRGK